MLSADPAVRRDAAVPRRYPGGEGWERSVRTGATGCTLRSSSLRLPTRFLRGDPVVDARILSPLRMTSGEAPRRCHPDRQMRLHLPRNVAVLPPTISRGAMLLGTRD